MAEDSTHPIGSVTWVQEAQALGAPFPKMTTEQYYPEAFNQAGRFNNSADLVNYVCAFEPMDHPSRRSYFDPLCPFPYLNAGWILPVSNTSDITFDDCSLLMSDASPRYNSVCLLYVFLASWPIPVLLFYLKRINDQKEDKKKMKKFYFIKKPNVGEQLIYWAIFLSFTHTLMSVDITNWANRIPTTISDALMGTCYGIGMSIMSTLVTSWITIVDGGKSKRAPKWAVILRRLSIFFVFVNEIGITFAERRIGHAANYIPAAMDGNMMVTRYIIFISFFATYGIVSCFYGFKIIGMLMTGKKGMSSQSKKIVKLCFCCVLCCIVLCQLRLFPIPFLANSTVIVPAPCNEFGWNQPMNSFILFFEYVIIFATYPGKKKGKKVNPLTGKTEKQQSQLMFRSTGQSSVETSTETESDASGASQAKD